MSVINSNIVAGLAQNALVKNERAMNTAMEQLSTCKRINSAADDAAGMAISSKMSNQIRGLDKAVRNTMDAVSMIQVADGAAGSIENMLQRMRELAVQASSDTNTTDDVAAINAEFTGLRTAIDNVADTTKWNGGNLIDGTQSAATFQIGANNSQSMTVDLGNLKLNAFAAGTAGTAVITTSTTEIGNMTSVQFGAVTVNSSGLLAATDTTTLTAALNADSGFAQRYTAVATNATTVTVTEKPGFETAAGPVFSSQGTTGATTNVITTGVVSTLGLGANLSGLEVTSASVLTTLDNALRAVNIQRGEYGAGINRLEYTADNLANASTNTQSARSRIEDADYAKATTELARTQIIQQAGTAMLAQANQSAQGVMALLQG